MIPYHGGPITPRSEARHIYPRLHALVSFGDPRDIGMVAELCQSFIIDNGAFKFWRLGKTLRTARDWDRYSRFLDKWADHPGCDFWFIPDIIDGQEEENDRLIYTFWNRHRGGVPVWHMHESLARLRRLCDSYARVAIGSSGEYRHVGSNLWWPRMQDAVRVTSEPAPFHIRESKDAQMVTTNRPCVKLHGLRMLGPSIFTRLPLASADSSRVARSIGLDQSWFMNLYGERRDRALSLIGQIEANQSAASL